ncbi:MAG: hypothetical protein IIC04_08480 [Proteobacteria bacterium]|nr:hypothetical protein [Pseudomonadota bacterium]
MFYAFKDSVHKFWDVWSGLFEPLPYGDPHIASGALFVVFIVLIKLIVERGMPS